MRNYVKIAQGNKHARVQVGEKSGPLTIVRRTDQQRKNPDQIIWESTIRLREIVFITTANFRQGNRSCMKCGRERTRQAKMTQGSASLKASGVFYKLWAIHRGMMRRCYDAK